MVVIHCTSAGVHTGRERVTSYKFGMRYRISVQNERVVSPSAERRHEAGGYAARTNAVDTYMDFRYRNIQNGQLRSTKYNLHDVCSCAARDPGLHLTSCGMKTKLYILF